VTGGKYDKIIRSGRSGVYAAPTLVGPLRAAAKRAGIAWRDLDLAGVRDRDAFLRRSAEAFEFPDYFGRNWDALHECLLEAAGSGTPGAFVHWHRGAELAKRAPDAVRTALEILLEAATYWGSTGRVFIVVVDRDCGRGLNLPPLR
jgi:RNAse (barnase) inhibitor barstar